MNRSGLQLSTLNGPAVQDQSASKTLIWDRTLILGTTGPVAAYASMSQSSKPIVLIVEDEYFIRTVAVNAFEDAGFTVLVAEHAAQAIRVHANNGPIHILFTDVNMPGELSGIDLAERLRGVSSTIGIIVTSALPLPRSVSHLNAAFVSKPYGLQDVCSVAHGLLAA